MSSRPAPTRSRASTSMSLPSVSCGPRPGAKPVLLATVEGHYLGPGLCWDELLAVSRSGAITGATLSAEGQMLLLLPIMADTDLARADNVVRPWSRPVWSSRRDLVLVNLQRTSDR